MAEKNSNRIIDALYRAKILKGAVTGGADGRGAQPPLFGLAAFIATAGGIGFAPFAQGTFGSLLPTVVIFLAPGCLGTEGISAAIVMIPLIVVVYFAGVWASGVCEKVWGHDPGRVVIDEVAGTLVTLAFIPLTSVAVGAGFFLFRTFDIFKPWPVRRFERFSGGWGVMNDDMVAGVLANIVLRMVVALTDRF